MALVTDVAKALYELKRRNLNPAAELPPWEEMAELPPWEEIHADAQAGWIAEARAAITATLTPLVEIVPRWPGMDYTDKVKARLFDLIRDLYNEALADG